jgi:hypothetical protein
MTRDDVYWIARDTQVISPLDTPDSMPDYLERFAALVAAREREACAEACEQKSAIRGGEIFAARIRARGQPRA